jgi:hypothetical protein
VVVGAAAGATIIRTVATANDVENKIVPRGHSLTISSP